MGILDKILRAGEGKKVKALGGIVPDVNALEHEMKAAAANLDFEKEQVGLETVSDLDRKMVLDAFTCVECGRCQVNCPAWGAGKELNPKTHYLGNRPRPEGVVEKCTFCIHRVRAGLYPACVEVCRSS